MAEMMHTEPEEDAMESRGVGRQQGVGQQQGDGHKQKVGQQQGAGRRYGRTLTIGFGSYAVLLVVGILIAQAIPSSSWRFVAMLLPVPALVLVMLAVWRYLHEADELQGKILLESLGIGFAGGSLITFTWGLMQTVGAPAVPWTLVFPVYAACWLIGRAVAGWRYR